MVQQLFDAPYDQLPAPSKIPGAAIEFDTKGFGKVQFVHLFVNEAVCETKWSNGTNLQSFVSANQPTGWFKFENVPATFSPILLPPQYQKEGVSAVDSPVSGQDLQRLGYTQGKVVAGTNQLVYRQKGWNGFEYEVAVAWKRSGTTLVGVWTISSTFSEKEGSVPAGKLISQELANSGYEKEFNSHSIWWKNFWSKSAISLPDSILEKQWYLEQYKFGSAARADAPPISLQAVWTADNGKLPPWKGDFHHDLNTQLSYWPAYSANHLDLEEGYLNWMWKNREAFQKYTKTYFGTNGMNVPGVTTLTGEPMGGWIQYSFGPTVGCWLAQHFYLHWVYSKDEIFLREKAYPWLKDVAIYLEEISMKDENGKRKLPISASPEIHDNSINAWFTQTTNFDLSFIRWSFEKAAELATEVGRMDEAMKWKGLLKEWPELALDSLGGLAFAPGNPYIESHRHFSHLVSWYPLGTTDWSKGSKDQEIIQSTINTLEKVGTDRWCGYSFSWMGSLYARAFMGDKAAEILRTFSENFCLPNSFHVNGEQHNKGYSKFKYRPFTLEGNFAFAAAIQEMLIQSQIGVIRVFPAVPESWKDISFTSLRTQGAFLVSAQKKDGKVVKVEIVAEKGGICRFKIPFGENAHSMKFSWKAAAAAREEGGQLIVDFPVNGRMEMELVQLKE